ncbi:hypothetical protein ACWD4G_29555 [Streptomyces sp. NPDC002643]
MSRITRKPLLVPMALAATVSAVALAASPASAATINIAVASQAIPSGAGCVYVTDETSGGSAGPVRFAAGGSVTVNGINVNPGDWVHFDWRDANCGPTTIRNDTHVAPSSLGTVWNIN